MKISKIIASTVMIVALTTSTAFAVPKSENSLESRRSPKSWNKNVDFEKDPLKTMEQKKREIEKLLKENRISKEEAQRKIERIDKAIARIKEFDKLPLIEKKEKLVKDCEARLTRLMEKGWIDQRKAELLFIEFVEKINNWDGTGYPRFHLKEK